MLHFDLLKNMHVLATNLHNCIIYVASFTFTNLSTTKLMSLFTSRGIYFIYEWSLMNGILKMSLILHLITGTTVPQV